MCGSTMKNATNERYSTDQVGATYRASRRGRLSDKMRTLTSHYRKERLRRYEISAWSKPRWENLKREPQLGGLASANPQRAMIAFRQIEQPEKGRLTDQLTTITPQQLISLEPGHRPCHGTENQHKPAEQVEYHQVPARILTAGESCRHA